MELLVLGVVVLFIVIATVKFKMHPIFSLTIAAIASGFFLGMAPKSIMSTMVEGFGNTLSGYLFSGFLVVRQRVQHGCLFGFVGFAFAGQGTDCDSG